MKVAPHARKPGGRARARPSRRPGPGPPALGPYRDQDLSVKFFVHPHFGIMTLYERMAQLASHELKHLKQMGRALPRLSAART